MKNYLFAGYGIKAKFDSLKNPVNLKKKLSIVLPTYNEGKNIKKMVDIVRENLKSTDFKDSYEIIVIDDNSKDETPGVIDKLAKGANFIALHRYGKRGLFSAIQEGIWVSNGEYVMTMDADFSHPPELIPKFLKHADKYDIVYGSRYIKDGGMEAPFVRLWGSRILNLMCIVVAGLNVSDFGGQFRLFRKSSYEKIKFRYESRFAEYGIELFYRAKKLGLKTKAIPFTYVFREEGKSKMGNFKKLPFLGLKYLKTAVKLRMEKLF